MSLSPLNSLPLVSVPAGELLIEQDGVSDGIYFLVAGEVEVLKNGVQVAEVYEAGAVFGEMSWLMRTPPTATVRTLTACTFRHVPDPATFLLAHPEVTLHVAALLACRIDSLNRYVVEVKNQFCDRADHLGIMDQVLDCLVHRHPRTIPRRDAGH